MEGYKVLETRILDTMTERVYGIRITSEQNAGEYRASQIIILDEQIEKVELLIRDE